MTSPVISSGEIRGHLEIRDKVVNKTLKIGFLGILGLKERSILLFIIKFELAEIMRLVYIHTQK